MKKLILSLVLMSGYAQAQQETILTLPEAIARALEHKAEAEKARLNIRRGDAQIAEVKASAYPNISFFDIRQDVEGIVATNCSIAHCPEAGYLHDDFFGRRFLAAIDIGCPFWLSEHIHDPVIANTVSIAEIKVRVVVEGAPTDCAA